MKLFNDLIYLSTFLKLRTLSDERGKDEVIEEISTPQYIFSFDLMLRLRLSWIIFLIAESTVLFSINNGKYKNAKS